MAKNITKKNTLSINATISIDNDKVLLEIDSLDEPTNLVTFLSEFDGQKVSISVNQTTELA